MRRMKKISLFFYSCALFCAGVYGHIKYLDFFYPGLWYSVPKELAAESDGGQEAIPVSFAEQIVTSDTRLLVRIRDMDSGKVCGNEQGAVCPSDAGGSAGHHASGAGGRI